MKKLSMSAAPALFASVALLAACGGGGGGGDATVQTPQTTQTNGGQAATPAPPAGAPVPPAPAMHDGYTASADKSAVLSRLNADRTRCGFNSLTPNVKLDVAAQGHADWLALNNANGHFQGTNTPGFTGASVAERATAAGYTYAGVTENIATSFYGSQFGNQVGNGGAPTGASYSASTNLSATNALTQLYASVYHLQGVMVNELDVGLGVSVFNQDTGPSTRVSVKRLVINSGVVRGAVGPAAAADSVRSFPCAGTAGVNPVFGPEEPNPFPAVNLRSTPYGQPVYVTGGSGVLTVSSARITRRGGADEAVTLLTKANDPQQRVRENEAFVVPTQRLADNATYDVTVSGTSTGRVGAGNPTGAFTLTFPFTTATYTAE